MNWLLFLLVGLVLVVLDASFMQVLRLGEVWPQATPGLVAFVALWAARPAVPWAAVALGLLQDLSNPVVLADDQVVRILGPSALGWLFGTAALLPLRRVLLRRHPVAVGAATVVLSFLAGLVSGAIWVARGLLYGEPMPWPVGDGAVAIGSMGLDAIANGVVAVPIAWLAMRLGAWWRFPGGGWGGGWSAAGSRGFQSRRR